MKYNNEERWRTLNVRFFHVLHSTQSLVIVRSKVVSWRPRCFLLLWLHFRFRQLRVSTGLVCWFCGFERLGIWVSSKVKDNLKDLTNVIKVCSNNVHMAMTRHMDWEEIKYNHVLANSCKFTHYQYHSARPIQLWGAVIQSCPWPPDEGPSTSSSCLVSTTSWGLCLSVTC